MVLYFEHHDYDYQVSQHEKLHDEFLVQRNKQDNLWHKLS